MAKYVNTQSFNSFKFDIVEIWAEELKDGHGTDSYNRCKTPH